MNERHIKEEGLRDWFGKSKSKDGKSGWVNVVTGDSCASDKPGEGIPKCVSSAKRASMSKKERRSAAAAKRRKDPGQQQKTGAAKPTMVSTDPKKKMKVSESHYGASVNKIPDELDKAVKMHKSQAKRLRDSEVFKKDAGKTANKIPSQLDKAVALHTKQAKELRAAGVSEDKNCGCGQTPCKTYGEKKMDEEKFVPPYKELKTFAKEKEKKKSRMNAEGTEIVEAKDKKGKGSGTKDACYHKVKSRYSVWPSAYASGALVKCRKVGAANWGNKSEETEINPISFQQFQEKCWKGYEKKGMKTMFGKRYPNCVKKEGYAPGDVDQKVGAVTSIPKSEQDAARARILAKTKAKMKKGVSEGKSDGDPCWDTHKQVGMKKKGGKMVPNCVPKNEETEVSEGAAWTKKSGKNKEGGLNEKGRKSYERENPGSDLKAPSKKKGNKRRASFCARMKGMKKKLTSAKTANDPDSRINKSLRAWNC